MGVRLLRPYLSLGVAVAVSSPLIRLLSLTWRKETMKGEGTDEDYTFLFKGSETKLSSYPEGGILGNISSVLHSVHCSLVPSDSNLIHDDI